MPVTVDLIAAARPNFMKVAPLYKALAAESAWCRVRLVHTGQHYDANMSDAFLRDLGLPEPDAHLGIGGGSHAQQTGGVMIAYEAECLKAHPDWVVVVGDVNSTVACTLAAKKLGIKVAHLEAGLRSGDRSMPEELNRLATDALADLLWTPSADGDENLKREGVPASRIEMVGNIMIDSLEMMRTNIQSRRHAQTLGLRAREFGVVTLHRPSNVDDAQQLEKMVKVVIDAGARLPVVFPVHPRTRKMLEGAGLLKRLTGESRRKPPTSASRASRCARTPSGPSRSRRARIVWFVPRPCSRSSRRFSRASGPRDRFRRSGMGRPPGASRGV
jgi:UDP-N-acetylglucosamine 2-epimerase (non-hydrolysing)